MDETNIYIWFYYNMDGFIHIVFLKSYGWLKPINENLLCFITICFSTKINDIWWHMVLLQHGWKSMVYKKISVDTCGKSQNAMDDLGVPPMDPRFFFAGGFLEWSTAVPIMWTESLSWCFHNSNWTLWFMLDIESTTCYGL